MSFLCEEKRRKIFYRKNKKQEKLISKTIQVKFNGQLTLISNNNFLKIFNFQTKCEQFKDENGSVIKLKWLNIWLSIIVNFPFKSQIKSIFVAYVNGCKH